MTRSLAIAIMGPTASGKSRLAMALANRLPVEIVSVDSAQVYRGMDIGTAKPDLEMLRRTPHRLIDIRDPEESYSAGDFVRDARAEIDDILCGAVSCGRCPCNRGDSRTRPNAIARRRHDALLQGASGRSRQSG